MREFQLCVGGSRGIRRMPRQAWHGYDFTNATLPGVQWAGVGLQGTCLRRARLPGANLCGVDARGACFDDADLTGADFSAALLHRASFRRARLCRANLRQALLLSAHLEQAVVDEADFSGANCEWAWVTGVDFQECLVSCAFFVNVRGLSEAGRYTLEAGGGFTGTRPMILGRELYEGGS